MYTTFIPSESSCIALQSNCQRWWISTRWRSVNTRISLVVPHSQPDSKCYRAAAIVYVEWIKNALQCIWKQCSIHCSTFRCSAVIGKARLFVDRLAIYCSSLDFRLFCAKVTLPVLKTRFWDHSQKPSKTIFFVVLSILTNFVSAVCRLPNLL